MERMELEARKLRERRREEKLRRLRTERRLADALHGPPSQTELSHEERERILAAEIYTLSQQSYKVEHSTGTTAHLVWKRPKSGFAGNLFLTVITLGFWLIIWIPLGVLGDLVTPKHIYLEVLPDGAIERDERGWR